MRHLRVATKLTAQDHLPGHKESCGASGAVVVDVGDRDPCEAQAVINGPLTTRGVPWMNQGKGGRSVLLYFLSSLISFGKNVQVSFETYRRHIPHRLVRCQNTGFLHLQGPSDLTQEEDTVSSNIYTHVTQQDHWHPDHRLCDWTTSRVVVRVSTCFLGHVRVVIVVSGSGFVKLQQHNRDDEIDFQIDM